MLNETFANQLRLKIMDKPYPNQTYYGGFYSQDQDPYGTTHMSVLSEEGDAVAATDTINFGSGACSRKFVDRRNLLQTHLSLLCSYPDSYLYFNYYVKLLLLLDFCFIVFSLLTELVL